MALPPGDLLVATSADPLQPLSGGVFALCLPSPCWELCAGRGPLHGRLASSWLSPPLPPATYPLAVLQGVGLILGITSLAEFLEKFGILLSDFPFKASSATGQEAIGRHGSPRASRGLVGPLGRTWACVPARRLAGCCSPV